MRGKVAREAVADMKASKEAESSAPVAEAPAAEEEEEMPSGEDAEAAAAKLQARMRGKVAREAVADMKASKEAESSAPAAEAPAAEEEGEMPSGEDAEDAAAKLQARMRGKVAREA